MHDALQHLARFKSDEFEAGHARHGKCGQAPSQELLNKAQAIIMWSTIFRSATGWCCATSSGSGCTTWSYCMHWMDCSEHSELETQECEAKSREAVKSGKEGFGEAQRAASCE